MVQALRAHPGRTTGEKTSTTAHESRPIKATLDAMTLDGWWKDDSQVFKVTATKTYHSKLGCAGAFISVHEQ